MRRRLPPGVRMYTGDDFNYAELIEGDDHGHSDALLGIFDAIAPAASAALKHLAAGNTSPFQRRYWRRPCRCRAISSGPDPVLQDRRRVPRLAQWPPEPFHHDRRPGITRSTLHLGRHSSASPTGRPAGRPRPRRARGWRRRWRCGASPDAGNLPSFDQPRHAAQWLADPSRARCGRPTRHPGGLPLARPDLPEIGLAATARHIREPRAQGLGPLPRRHVPCQSTAQGSRPIFDDNFRAADEAAELAADCLVLVVGGLPDGLARSRRRPGAGGAKASQRLAEYAATLGVKLAIEPLHPMYCADRVRGQHHGAGAGPLRRHRRRRRRRLRCLPHLVGSRPSGADCARRRGPAACLPHLRLAEPHPRPAARPRHDGRRGDRHRADSAGRSRRKALPASTRSRSSRATIGGAAISTRCSGPVSGAMPTAADNLRNMLAFSASALSITSAGSR